MRMRYVARVIFEITTFVDCEGEDMLLHEAGVALDEAARSMAEMIRIKSGLSVWDWKLSELSGRPTNLELETE
jgi:hypothetical protein